MNNNNHNNTDYLNMIQGIINRMAGNSALMKGFAATVFAALLAVAKEEWYYTGLSILPLLGFVILDVYYLRLEKKYRNLYALVAEGKVKNTNYTLDLRNKVFRPFQKEINANAGVCKTLFSVSIGLFYIWFLVVAIILTIIALI